MTNLVGDLPRIIEIWYYPTYIANILSLALVKNLFCIAYKSEDDNILNGHQGNRKTLEFREPKGDILFRHV